MQLALFDLDNTLLDGDSDHLWGEFLIAIGVLDAARHRKINDDYYQQYLADRLDIYEFLAFQLAPIAAHPREVVHQWRVAFVQECIRPRVTDSAIALVDEHRQRGHELGIVTATNRFITEPIAALYGIDTLLAIELEEVDGHYTGRPTGVPSSGEGKVTRVQQHYGADVFDRYETWFYSDSVRDLPLLGAVDHPVVVNGDEALLAYSGKVNWPALNLRGETKEP